ncbi:MAG TPA: nucleotide pyrophosphohydrolase [Steroidobacteraceae bacterium]|jgi:dCTP diphosphatase|nr:nucleotide pyrophosphohydrolase [Steroidobacteraceae bacterium]
MSNLRFESIEQLRDALRAFSAERDWEQFHSPKNLSMALTVETGELLEHFQWMSEQESRQLSDDKLTEVRAEMADVFIYLVRLADKLGVDLLAAAAAKIEFNARRYPADEFRGSSRKYSELKTRDIAT